MYSYLLGTHCTCFHDTALYWRGWTGFNFRRGQKRFVIHTAHYPYKISYPVGAWDYFALWQAKRIIMLNTHIQKVMKIGIRGVIPPELKNMSNSPHH